ncbi:class I SAM-dependent methyltransferase [Streptomyces sp. NPDC059629]|uniref:class I SAM-dependent methyltransferase n=1 Tax=Streptomyces sp. NPDC059629 TaxID=3346889 RepID=UPI00369897D0
MADWEEVADHPGYRGLCRALLDATGPARGERILDIGTGTGIVPELIRRYGPGEVRVTAVDPDPRMVGLASRYTDPGHCVVGGFGNLRPLFAPASFDCAVAANSLHLAPDVSRAVHEVAGLLVPGGRFALLTGYFDGAQAPESVPVYTRVLRRALRIAREEGVLGRDRITLRPGTDQVTVLRRAALGEDLVEAGFHVIHDDIHPLDIDAGLAAAMVSADMIAGAVFTGPTPQESTKILRRAVAEVAPGLTAGTLRRNYLLIVARLQTPVETEDWRDR